jgi:hypothetical protein
VRTLKQIINRHLGLAHTHTHTHTYTHVHTRTGGGVRGISNRLDSVGSILSIDGDPIVCECQPREERNHKQLGFALRIHVQTHIKTVTNTQTNTNKHKQRHVLHAKTCFYTHTHANKPTQTLPAVNVRTTAWALTGMAAANMNTSIAHVWLKHTIDVS